MFRAIIITLIGFFCLYTVAHSAEVSPTILAEKAIKYSVEGPTNIKDKPKDVQDYIELTDLIIGTFNSDLRSLIDTNESLPAGTLDLFKAYNTAQYLSLDEFGNNPDYKLLLKATSDSNEQVAYISNFLLSVLHLKQYDLLSGLLFAETSTRLATNYSNKKWQTVYLHDSYSIAFTGLALDRNKEMVLQTLESLLNIAGQSKRSLDGFTLVNNLAMVYHNLSLNAEALDIIRTLKDYVDYADDENIVIYYYTTGLLEVENQLYQEAVESLEIAKSRNTNVSLKYHIAMRLSTAYARLGDNRKSQIYLDLISNAPSDEIDKSIFDIDVLLIKALMAENDGQTEGALILYKEWSLQNIGVLSRAIDRDRQEISAKIAATQKFTNAELARVNRENELNDIIIEETEQKNRFKNVMLLLLAMGTLVTAFLAYRLYLSRREAEHSRDQAVASEQVKTNILAAMSHEFRTPLNAIIPLSELLGTQLNSPDVRAKLSLIKNAGLSLLSMVDNLCTIANPSTDGTIYAEPVNFNDFALKIIAEWNADFKAKNVLLKAQTRKSSDNVFNVSKNATRMILENLLSNALKFTNAGSVTVAFYEHKDENGRSLILEVTDTGIGIDHEKLQGYLEPFSQEDMGLARSYQGLGIGLAAVNALVETCNGTISFVSNVPTGTSVRVSIPENTAAEAAILLAA